MNDNTPNPALTANAEPPVIAAPPPAPVRRKRRWWFYALVGLGAAVFLAVAALLGLSVFWHSLIRNYTATQPEPVPHADDPGTELENLYFRFIAFQDAVETGKAPAPFKLCALDLNRAIANNPQLKHRLFLIITNNQVLGRFSFPLDQAKQHELTNRFLNGQGRLGLAFQDGRLTVNIVELKTNGKPVPKWILKKVQTQNLAKDLGQNPDATNFLSKLASIKLEEDQIVLTPLPKN